MSQLSVWAPKARRVEVEVGGERRDLAAAPRGYFETDVGALGHGADYALFLDGRGPWPDPRSPWQPNGVFGRSRWVDHERYAWRHTEFRAPPLAGGLVYEMHIGTFSPEGTFAGAIDRLPHLAGLGVTHVELLPVAEFPGTRGWGYDGVFLFAPHHAYGGPEGMKRFVDACHAHGLAVLLDVVYNHVGPSGNVLGEFGDYFNEEHRTPWGPAMNLEGPGSDEVRRFFCDNARQWLRDYRIDGLRLDAVHAYHDRSAVPFARQLAGEAGTWSAELGRPLVLVGESDLNDPQVVMAPEAGGWGLEAQWSDDFHHAIHAFFSGERAGYYGDYGRLADVAKALEQVFVYDGRYSEFRRRSHGRPVGELPRTAFLGYLQNHDQIGNRPRGDRAASLMSSLDLKTALALVLGGPFVPMLFQGEEWGTKRPFAYFCDHVDPDLARAVSDGRRAEFAGFGRAPAEVPDPQAEATFLSSKLVWEERESAEAQDMLRWVSTIIRLRRQTSRGDGKARVRYDEVGKWLLLITGDLAVAANIGPAEASIDLGGEGPPWHIAVAAGSPTAMCGRELRVGPGGCSVLVR